MNPCKSIIPILSVLVLLAAGCSDKKEERARVDSAKQPDEEPLSEAALAQGRMERLQHINSQRALRGPSVGLPVELMEVDRGRELLPEQLLDMQRESLTAQTEKLSHLSMAEIVTRYARGESRSVRVGIVDLAGMKHVAGLPVLPWVDQDIDEKTDVGHVKTFSFHEHKGLEEYDGTERSVHIQLLLNRRLLVEIRESGVDRNESAAILQALPLQGLADLAKALPGTQGYIDARPSSPEPSPRGS